MWQPVETEATMEGSDLAAPVAGGGDHTLREEGGDLERQAEGHPPARPWVCWPEPISDRKKAARERPK